MKKIMLIIIILFLMSIDLTNAIEVDVSADPTYLSAPGNVNLHVIIVCTGILDPVTLVVDGTNFMITDSQKDCNEFSGNKLDYSTIWYAPSYGTTYTASVSAQTYSPDESGFDSVNIVVAPAPSPPGGGGGGGGGFTPCKENWTCTNWTECAPNGTQTRICIDINKCGTTTKKPKEVQNCIYIPPTFCGDGICQSNENCTTCATDCGDCPLVCGNGICESGETPYDPTTGIGCLVDCGRVPGCGDGICQPDEDCNICPTDCGICPTPTGITGLITGFASTIEKDPITTIAAFIGIIVIIYLLWYIKKQREFKFKLKKQLEEMKKTKKKKR